MIPPTLAGASLKGLCPRCGARSLFRGPVALAKTCATCGLDFDALDVGDGPAVFLILIVGTILVVSALVTDLRYAPAWWVHLVWIPVGIVLTMVGLRIGKAILAYQSFRHQAGEGRIIK
ncbi:MAG: DUF983 domain-containing protein [Sphingomonas bacterium]|nr:DUF983 domain-containing protein [Sphingomonas bacterium]